MNDGVVVLLTCASARQAARIARALVEGRLAACVNVVKTKMTSIYRWKGKVQQAPEILLLIKSRRRLLKPLERVVKRLHSYTTPELIALPIRAGSPDYLAWLAQNLRSPNSPTANPRPRKKTPRNRAAAARR